MPSVIKHAPGCPCGCGCTSPCCKDDTYFILRLEFANDGCDTCETLFSGEYVLTKDDSYEDEATCWYTYYWPYAFDPTQAGGPFAHPLDCNPPIPMPAIGTYWECIDCCPGFGPRPDIICPIESFPTEEYWHLCNLRLQIKLQIKCLSGKRVITELDVSISGMLIYYDQAGEFGRVCQYVNQIWSADVSGDEGLGWPIYPGSDVNDCEDYDDFLVAFTDSTYLQLFGWQDGQFCADQLNAYLTAVAP